MLRPSGRRLWRNMPLLISAGAAVLLITGPRLRSLVFSALLGLLVLLFCLCGELPKRERGSLARELWVSLFTAGHALALSVGFYETWCNSRKLAALAATLGLSKLGFYTLVGLIGSLVGFYALRQGVLLLLWLGRGLRLQQRSKRQQQLGFVLSCLLVSLLLLLGVQLLQNGAIYMGPWYFVLNLALITGILLLFLALTLHFRAAVLCTLVVTQLFSLANYLVYQFRGAELSPLDFLSLQTAMNVAGSYRPSLGGTFFYAMLPLLWLGLLLYLLPNWKSRGPGRRLVLLGAELCLILGLLFCTADKKSSNFSNNGSQFTGTCLNFCLKLKSGLFVEEPEGYSAQLIALYEQDYSNPETQDSDALPNIIVIMNESFADLSVLGSELSTNIAVTPFLDSLTENTVRGYALSSVYGGNTSNSEYEFLTGFSMAFAPTGCIAYQHNSFIYGGMSSLVSILNGLGYSSRATHPYYASGWMRTTVYSLLQFGSYSFMDDYPQSQLVRAYISDQEMVEYIIADYQDRDTESPYFLFGVSMQNHGGYTDQEYQATVQLVGYEGDYPQVEQYLSLIHETDSAMEYLISYFSQVEEPVVLLFFGDHQPFVETEFYQELHGGSLDSLSELELEYIVPFFIWANYDIQEQTVELTSLNYLSNYLMEVAGLEKSAFQQYLSDLMELIPAINAQGYYSLSRGCFVALDQAEGEEAQAILQYQQLQYNALMDSENRSTVFFPITE